MSASIPAGDDEVDDVINGIQLRANDWWSALCSPCCGADGSAVCWGACTHDRTVTAFAIAVKYVRRRVRTFPCASVTTCT